MARPKVLFGGDLLAFRNFFQSIFCRPLQCSCAEGFSMPTDERVLGLLYLVDH